MAGRPRTNFNQRRKLALEDFRQQVIESQSQIASLFLEMPNGEEYEIPHPMLISDEAQKRLEIVQAGEDLDRNEDGTFVVPARINGDLAEPEAIRMARALLGDEAHKKFIEAGGHSNDISLAWRMLLREQQKAEGADPK